MSIAQKLYEGMEIGEESPVGLITYMRTDSTRISNDALQETRQYIEEKFGKPYLPGKPHSYKTQKAAQEAHEAIRPTSVYREPDRLKKYLSKDELNLYTLIWKRLVASQMKPAVMDVTTIDILAGKTRITPPHPPPRRGDPPRPPSRRGFICSGRPDLC